MSKRHMKKVICPANNNLSVIILGASGDLSKRKILPALFSLYLQNYLPAIYRIVGYARSSLTVDDLKKRSMPFLKKTYGRVKETFNEEEFNKDLNGFFKSVYYFQGMYDKKEDFVKLNEYLTKFEKEPMCLPLRLFYFSLPPHVFLPAAENVGNWCKVKEGENRVLLEKPFGRSFKSYEELNKKILGLFKLKEIYRIDHYIGKEVVQNLIALRFANIIFDSLWNRTVIKNVQIVFKEQLGVEGRGGYFDEYGIIRDVMQNHMMQILCYIAMEPPVSLSNKDIAAEKMKVLKCIEPLQLKNAMTGQYKGKKGKSAGYTDDETVPNDSLTETFAAAVLFIKNRRWDGVPFMLKCGKGLDESLVEIRVQFNSVPANIFKPSAEEQSNNELVIRVQPDEAIYFNLQNKIPGLKYELATSKLDFTYHDSYKSNAIPDAYERLILNCIQGDDSNFVHPEELALSWEIFDEFLNHIEEKKVKPEKYYFASRGPVGSDYLAASFSQKWSESD